MKDKYRAYSAEKLIEELEYCGCDPYYDSIRKPVVKEIFRRLKAWEKGEPERPHGEWKQVGEMTYKCTKCGWLKKIGLMPYCENCGADMREGEASDKTSDNR